MGSSPIRDTQMITIAYVLIGIGLLLTFLLWRTWKSTDRLINEFGVSPDEIEESMKSLHYKIYICYGLAFFFKLLAWKLFQTFFKKLRKSAWQQTELWYNNGVASNKRKKKEKTYKIFNLSDLKSINNKRGTNGSQ